MKNRINMVIVVGVLILLNGLSAEIFIRERSTLINNSISDRAYVESTLARSAYASIGKAWGIAMHHNLVHIGHDVDAVLALLGLPSRLVIAYWGVRYPMTITFLNGPVTYLGLGLTLCGLFARRRVMKTR